VHGPAHHSIAAYYGDVTTPHPHNGRLWQFDAAQNAIFSGLNQRFYPPRNLVILS
jgi:hypothetical protein